MKYQPKPQQKRAQRARREQRQQREQDRWRRSFMIYAQAHQPSR